MAVTISVMHTLAGSGQTASLYRIVETNVAAATEYTLNPVPTYGTIVKFTAELVGGTAATIKPIVGGIAGFTADTVEEVFDTPTAAAFINRVGPTNEVGYLGGPFVGTGVVTNTGYLAIRSTPNAGADNEVHTLIVILHGAGP